MVRLRRSALLLASAAMFAAVLVAPAHAAKPKPAPSGATAQCWDSTYSYSAHRRGTCSHHGGVRVWLKRVPAVHHQVVAAPKTKPFYADELTVSNNIEEKQVIGRAHIQNAYCQGQRWRGVKTDGYGLDRFTYFACTLNATDGHTYSGVLHTSAAARRGYYNWKWLSLKKDY